MNKESIPKQPVLKPAEDYYRLRREGIGFIEKMASSLWTDYNSHDPGITILEVLCYALTDLAYRLSWENKDLFSTDHQAFFTAHEILTSHPVTTDDFRRLLIDLPKAHVRNAWVFKSHCGCDFGYYAKCQDNELQLSYQKTADAKKVELAGLYEVLLEFEPHIKPDETANLIKLVKTTLHDYRNLDEDFCRIHVVDVENIAVCADVEVTADADIERVQAQIWFAIENYLNPPIRFYTLQELLDSKIPVESIFNGPKLHHGFIRDEDLQAAQLKTVLRTSDILNALMDIEGVVAVNHLLLSKYDAEGKQLIAGAADPDIDTEGKLNFSAHKLSAAWSLYLQDKHQPRLHRDLSRFLFFKNGLPFQPRKTEAEQTLIQLRGETERPKISNAPTDLPIPSGTVRDLEAYYPLQYSFPLTYGIGAEGLPSSASAERKAQAKQLKAYLMVFEQLFVNALAQLAQVNQLFSLDFTVNRTYFVKELTESLIQGYDELLHEFSKTELAALTESSFEFYERRNRFLNHVMARFGEQFTEYALLLTNYQGQQVAQQRLIEDKIAFLKAYPVISGQRSKAFNYQKNPYTLANDSGLKKRISLLLGYPDLVFAHHDQDQVKFPLQDASGHVWLVSQTTQMFDLSTLLMQLSKLTVYSIIAETQQFRLTLSLVQSGTTYSLQHPILFDTQTEAENVRDELIAWAANQRAIVVEHLLLRPKFLGDALYPVCSEQSCQLCGATDPYSFRLTVVMAGWTDPYNTNLEMRSFANRTIQQETPAHLLVKICWLDNTGFEPNPCGEPVLAILAEILEQDPVVNYTRDQACDCARTIFETYRAVFAPWFDQYKTYHWLKSTWQSKLTTLFKHIQLTDFECTASILPATWQRIHDELLNYFIEIALYGWQFERFEQAWYQWLAVNAKIDWETQLSALKQNILAVLQQELSASDSTDLCACVTTLFNDYGQLFHQWLETHSLAGKFWQDFGSLPTPNMTVCDDNLSLSAAAKQTIQQLLIGKQGYGGWVEVSYRLWIVVHLLSQLRNTYPGATLHDCDDSSDQNPVRLGNTALGNYPLRSSAT